MLKVHLLVLKQLMFLDTVATATFQGAEVDWYIKADDIVLKKGAAMNPQLPKKDAPPVK